MLTELLKMKPETFQKSLRDAGFEASISMVLKAQAKYRNNNYPAPPSKRFKFNISATSKIERLSKEAKIPIRYLDGNTQLGNWKFHENFTGKDLVYRSHKEAGVVSFCR